jgi:tetratricopeptide (TPR) repeat protein
MIQSFNLGTHTRPVSTTSPEAQYWFDQGLNWCFGFNHEEGVKCFEKALESDPACAMAHWGIAYGSGPFYNMPWGDFTPAEAGTCTKLCHAHIETARTLAKGGPGAEAALIEALAARIQKNHAVPQAEFNDWDDAYADAMRGVYRQFPQDQDVAAIFAEAMMTRTPWKLWDVRTNQPAAGADTLEALQVIETAIAQADAQGLTQHPAILHLHIHVTEMSATPERALVSADILGDLCPEAGHLNHMPGHTYVLCGQYEKAKIASEKAMLANRKFLAYAGPYNFFTAERCHDMHLMIYTCMFLGQFGPAMAAAQEIRATLTPDVLNVPGKPYLAMTMEGYYAMDMHVLVRFGKWQQIIDTVLPDDPVLYCASVAMHHYARVIAHAALGQFTAAEAERELFHAACARIPAGRKFFNNAACDVLGVAEEMLTGELHYHKGSHQMAYGHLREAVRRDDALAYSEPWAWMHPPRHALGALLMEQGFVEEAEQVYRADLGLNDTLQRCSQHPDNIWSLHGLAECLRKRGADRDLARLQLRLDAAAARTDVRVSSSCCCRKQVA